ncbi:hypothetical protein U1Q18_029876 [Sarracenia purpurea var. burkii]
MKRDNEGGRVRAQEGRPTKASQQGGRKEKKFKLKAKDEARNLTISGVSNAGDRKALAFNGNCRPSLWTCRSMVALHWLAQ